MQTYDDVVLGAVEDMFYDFDSEKQLEIWNEYCDKELSHWSSYAEDGISYAKVYHNTPAFFTDVEMKERGLSAEEILERIKQSGNGYSPNDRYITVITIHNPRPKPNEYHYLTSNRAGDLTDGDPSFGGYLIDLYKQED